MRNPGLTKLPTMITTMMTGIKTRSRVKSLRNALVVPAPASAWTASRFMLSPKPFHGRDDVMLAPAAGERFRDFSAEDDFETVAGREFVQIVGHDEDGHLL